MIFISDSTQDIEWQCEYNNIQMQLAWYDCKVININLDDQTDNFGCI